MLTYVDCILLVHSAVKLIAYTTVYDVSKKFHMSIIKIIDWTNHML